MITLTNNQPENPYAKLVPGQSIAEVPSFELESGDILRKVPVAFKSWGKLNSSGTNCLVICHALSGSADVSDWWGPLLGRGKAFDPSKFFIVCLNSLGSPYGSASPVTRDPEINELYGPEFPLTTVRDDVKLHRLVLEFLGVKQIALVVGGSMGGMLALEWMFHKDYVRACVPLATSARHSAWCISWGEAQRQCIYSDPKYDDGYYPLEDPPLGGLSAARMSALLTYRSRNSFEARFGRNSPSREQAMRSKTLSDSGHGGPVSPSLATSVTFGPSDKPSVTYAPPAPVHVPSSHEENFIIHNHGRKSVDNSFRLRRGSSSSSISSTLSSDAFPPSPGTSPGSAGESGTVPGTVPQRQRRRHAQHFFSAQSYLRYQGDKFVSRFDANCYISITRKLDTHDVARDRPEFDSIEEALASLQQPTLVIGIQSDALFTYSEQMFIAKHIPNAKLVRINSPEGHDAFLLEFNQINQLMLDFMNEHLKDIMNEAVDKEWSDEDLTEKKESVFGEAEDVTNW